MRKYIPATLLLLVLPVIPSRAVDNDDYARKSLKGILGVDALGFALPSYRAGRYRLVRGRCVPGHRFWCPTSQLPVPRRAAPILMLSHTSGTTAMPVIEDL